MKRACIIGAGFGGLALAIRLQAAGIATTLIEARDKVGGRGYGWQRGGFTFGAGPMTITCPDALAQLWNLSGAASRDSLELLPIQPFTRFNWPDGVNFDLSGDDQSLRAEIARIAPDDLAGFAEFQLYAASLAQQNPAQLAKQGTRAILNALPALARLQLWRSFHGIISRFIKSDHLRDALALPVLAIGGNPMRASALHAATFHQDKMGGKWWPKGGMGALAEAMAAQFEKMGGTLRLHDPVLHIHTHGDRASEVETISGWRERFDAVASNADILHSYRDLLSTSQRGPEMARKLAAQPSTPSAFVVHFALEGSWPGIPHHTVLMGPRFAGLMDDIFDHGVLPRDMLIQLYHPTVTDQTLAPAGKSVFQAVIPVAHLGKLPIDWEQIGPVIENRVLDEVGRRLIPDIHDRIITKFHYTPRDFALDLNAYQGTAYGFEPSFNPMGWQQKGPSDAKLRNLFLVGASAGTGAGIPAVLDSAKQTAQAMMEILR